MEEDEINLIDYFRVIWKRKRLIIVGTLVCIVVGVVMNLMLPVTYLADAAIKIGKKVELQLPSANISSVLINLESPTDLSKSILIKYGQNIEGGIGFDLDAEVINGTSMIRITLKGPDSRTKKILKEIVNKVIDEHLRMTENSVLFYKTLIEQREGNINEIRKELAQEALMLEEISTKEALALKEMSIDLDKEMGVEMDIDEADPLTLMMIWNKMIENQNIRLRRKEQANNNLLRLKQIAQNNLKQASIIIRSIQEDIFLCQLTINTLNDNRTKLIGEIREDIVQTNMKRNIILAGVVGIIIFLLLAFIMEYVEKIKEREQDVSV